MNYQEVIQYLYNATPVFEHIGAAAYKPGLQTTEALDAHYGHPHEHYRTIHVAGTNGKGSVSHSLASILQEAGLRVGLYTSPHLVDFRERIRVNGECISEDYVIRFVEDFIRWNSADEQAPEHKDVLYPSFFELTTALAFKYFADANVDVAVVEVGLGGRLDCTNIIRPELCVITNIALDHTQFLGSTLAEIASEKAGIIKPGVPVVIGETTPETKPVFEKKAQEAHAPIFYAEDFTWPAPLPDFELKGSYQTRNLQTILCAANQLKEIEKHNVEDIASVIPQALTHVCQNTGLMGRWQTLHEQPLVVCDTGHNPAAWTYLGKQLANLKCHELHIVFGMVEDKDVYSVMSLLPKNARYFFTKGSTKRAFPETSLKIFADQFDLKGECYPTVSEAYEAAMQGATSEDVIFIGGSTYVVADFLKTRI
jgi:dihydrofolate synthase/folylpolyglutamate synthase